MTTPLSPSETSLAFATGPSLVARPQSVFDQVPDLQIYQQRWQARVNWYAVLRSYYRGTFYSDWPQLRELLKLYAGIRQIFGPLRRAVRVDVAKVPGSWTIAEDVPPAVVQAVEQVRAWSGWRIGYKRAVQHGAVAGEFGLLVVADTDAVRVLPLRPDEVVMGEMANGESFGLIVKPNLVDRGGRYEYAQVITPSFVRIYRSGAIQSEIRNRYGFVPLLLSPYLTGEDGVGECAFAGTQELLDRVNDATSQTLDVVQRNAEPITVFSGVDAVAFDAGNNAVVLSRPDARAYTLTPNLAVDQALALVETVLREFKNLLPQLILDDMRSRNDLAYDTVVTLLMELTDHITDVRDNVDTAIETAERWAVTMGREAGLLPSVDPVTHHLDATRPVIQPTEAQRLALDAQRLGVAGATAALDAQRVHERASEQPMDDQEDADVA